MPAKKINYESFEQNFTDAIEGLISKTIFLMKDYDPNEINKKLDESQKHVMNACKMHEAVSGFYQKKIQKDKENSLISDRIMRDDDAIDKASELLTIINIEIPSKQKKIIKRN